MAGCAAPQSVTDLHAAAPSGEDEGVFATRSSVSKLLHVLCLCVTLSGHT